MKLAGPLALVHAMSIIAAQCSRCGLIIWRLELSGDKVAGVPRHGAFNGHFPASKGVANMLLLVLTAQYRPQAHPTILKEADCMFTDREAIHACMYGLILRPGGACTVVELFHVRNRCSYSVIGSADKNGSDPTRFNYFEMLDVVHPWDTAMTFVSDDRV